MAVKQEILQSRYAAGAAQKSHEQKSFGFCRGFFEDALN